MKTEYLFAVTFFWGILLALGSRWPYWATVSRQGGACLEGLASQPRRVALFLFGLSFVLNALIGVGVGIPQPFIHDEFAYLLAAETFAQGRLTNPTPLGWEHFEAVHVLLRPTYMARYLPGAGLFLALGQVLTGYPIVGVWLTCALAVALTFWALKPALEPRTALLVALVLLFCPQMRIWGQTYWGGSLAVCGGALVLGAALRQKLGLALGLGVSVLLLSRPFEGSVFCVAVLVYLGPTLRRQALPLRSVGEFLVPLGVTMAFLGIYNRAVTGSAWELPYLHYLRQYDSAPTFAFQPEFPIKQYQSRFIADFWAYIAGGYHWGRAHIYGTSVTNLVGFLQLILANPVLVLALLYGFVRKVIWRELAVLFGFFLVLVSETFAWSHYAAPVLPFVCLVVGRALERVVWQRLGVVLVLGAALLGYGVNVVAYRRWYRELRPQPILQKVALQKRLEKEPTPVAVFLRYVPQKEGDLWLYNASQPQSARVLWLSHLGEERDRAFLDAYPNRKAFLLDIATQQLQPYLETR